MKEAFRRHLPIWVGLLGLLVIAIIILPVLLGNKHVEPSQFTDDESAGNFTLSLSQVAKGFEAPVDIVASGQADDQRLFIVEQGGHVKILEDGEVAAAAFLDISNKVLNDGEQGLLGMVFSPDRAYVYVNYVRPVDDGRETVIARYDVRGDQTRAEEKSEKVILSVNQPYANHNAGDLAFGPDGYLYIPLGDGGSGGDPNNNAQNKSSLLGKILRLDVNGGDPYAIPEDNPFVDEDDTRPEIWSYGWRNPWRLSFDNEGNMWVADVGQNKFEEINRELAGESGRNYGWRCWEGNEEFKLESACPEREELVFPVAVYPHQGLRCSGSISGGYVYQGQRYPQLNGFYLAADYCSGRIYRLDTKGEPAELEVALETELGISTFGEDNAGELYLADRNDGGIYRVELTPQ